MAEKGYEKRKAQAGNVPSHEGTSLAVDPRPLAALRLGYVSRTIGLDRVRYDADVDVLFQSISTLGEGIPANKYTDIYRILDSLREASPTPTEADGDLLLGAILHSVDNAMTELREPLVLALAALTDTVLAESTLYRLWYDLGAALGDNVRKAPHQKGRVPSLRPVIACIERLPQQEIERHRVLQQLRSFQYTGRKPQELKAQLSVRVELVCDVQAVKGSGAIWETVFRTIEMAIEKEPPLLPSKETAGVIQGGLTQNLFVPTMLQAKILEALKGRALMTDPLAAIVCGGESTRLYRPGGIKELMDVGLVDHKEGRGYYRPNAPPPDAVLLQQPQ